MVSVYGVFGIFMETVFFFWIRGRILFIRVGVMWRPEERHVCFSVRLAGMDEWFHSGVRIGVITRVLCVDGCNALFHMLINFFYVSVSFQLPSSVTIVSSPRGYGGICTSFNAEVTRTRLFVV